MQIIAGICKHNHHEIKIQKYIFVQENDIVSLGTTFSEIRITCPNILYTECRLDILYFLCPVGKSWLLCHYSWQKLSEYVKC